MDDEGSCTGRTGTRLSTRARKEGDVDEKEGEKGEQLVEKNRKR